MTEGSAQIVLGDEWDNVLRADLDAILEDLDAARTSAHGSIAGSQEWSSENWQIGTEILIVERETYMGLSIAGPEMLVDTVAAAVAARKREQDSPLPSQPRGSALQALLRRLTERGRRG